MKIYLASSSPRRQELLQALGLQFDVLVPDILEFPMQNEKPSAYALRNAQEKALKVCAARRNIDPTEDFVTIAADTIVVLNNTILEKPVDEKHAVLMLKSLSGQSHMVITAVSLAGYIKGVYRHKSFNVDTQVLIKNLSDEEIDWYVSTKEPLDKAGSYAAQGKGSLFIEKIEGSFTNVVGLPIFQLFEALREHFGIMVYNLEGSISN
ncbi:MAG: septum formation inhibitor Maf [Oligoflexales bacterium]|nr:septum formation inhibitor Maf [Oligoflexales bacterium]